MELERPIFDLSINEQSSLLSVVEGRQTASSNYEEDDSICRLYDIGRKRASEDDSDAEDDQEESDLLEDDEFDEDEDEDVDEDDEDQEDEGMSDDDMEEFDEEGSAGSDDSEFEGEEGDTDSNASSTGMTLEELEADVEDTDEDSEAQYDSSLERSGLSGRDFRLVFEIPDVSYYDVHGQYSSDEEDEEDE